MAQKVITRVIEQSPVEFTCRRCGKLTVRLVYPGQPPLYCEECLPIVRRENARLRKARQRARERANK